MLWPLCIFAHLKIPRHPTTDTSTARSYQRLHPPRYSNFISSAPTKLHPQTRLLKEVKLLFGYRLHGHTLYATIALTGVDIFDVVNLSAGVIFLVALEDDFGEHTLHCTVEGGIKDNILLILEA
jgi:hypothetical protein